MLADKHRNVAILSGRDCSMQRRFQKIVEEGPPISVGPDTMRAMELAAAKLSLMVDYTHAGTVEYLFIEETGEFYFLELNPRLQVEHPVTEGITGMNIPSLQLMVAMGVDLTKIDGTMDTPMKAIAPYICDVVNPSTANPFAKTDGHVVAVRITAEHIRRHGSRAGQLLRRDRLVQRFGRHSGSAAAIRDGEEGKHIAQRVVV